MPRYDAVLLDAYGTLVELDGPFTRLRAAVGRHLGADIDPAEAERAFRIEMQHYSDRCHVAADADSLAALRAECARVLLDELGIGGSAEAGNRVLSDAVAFRVLPDVEPFLTGLAQAGIATAVVSLTGAVKQGDNLFTGRPGAKPAETTIEQGFLEGSGVEPARALHVGDRADSDAAGAAAAGIDVRIVDRTGAADGRDTIAALTDVLELL